MRYFVCYFFLETCGVCVVKALLRQFLLSNSFWEICCRHVVRASKLYVCDPQLDMIKTLKTLCACPSEFYVLTTLTTLCGHKSQNSMCSQLSKLNIIKTLCAQNSHNSMCSQLSKLHMTKILKTLCAFPPKLYITTPSAILIIQSIRVSFEHIEFG